MKHQTTYLTSIVTLALTKKTATNSNSDLVRNIPRDLVLWSVEDKVQGDGELDDPKG